MTVAAAGWNAGTRMGVHMGWRSCMISRPDSRVDGDCVSRVDRVGPAGLAGAETASPDAAMATVAPIQGLQALVGRTRPL